MRIRLTTTYGPGRSISFLFVFFLSTMGILSAQVTPETGMIECFSVGEGGVFVDNGGPGGDPTNEGTPGNYPNCDCVTTTTLCSVDGTPLTVEFTEYTIFAEFDWMVILDAPNLEEEVYPFSILDDPTNVNLQMFNNADGIGDGGSENYGQGPDDGNGTLATMSSTVFTSTNPTGCLTFVFRASGVVDDPGWSGLISVAGGGAHPGDDVVCDPPSCPAPEGLTAFNVDFESASISWIASDSASAYIIEYGPTGFTLGTGTQVLTSNTDALLSGLLENTLYDVYVIAECDMGELSFPDGPVTFQTDFLNPPATCFYTIELYDSASNGWGTSNLVITVNGISTTYALDNINDDGAFAAYTFPVFEGFPVVVQFNPGTSPNQISYILYDSDGLVLFEDGPSPTSGEVYNELAFCPACPAIDPNSIEVFDVAAETAAVSWTSNGVTSSYIIEYGPTGFTPGTGTQVMVTGTDFLLTGLMENTFYDVYVIADCGADGLSVPAGTVTFQTLFLNPPTTCFYTLELNDSFGDGWNGSFLEVTVNGVTTTYTLDNINDDGSSATFQVEVLDGLPIILEYTPGSFQNEVTYTLLDADQIQIFSDGPFPAVGLVFEQIANCPVCPAVNPSSVMVESVTAESADISWTPSSVAISYIIEYGPTGFPLGFGVQETTNDASTTIAPLNPCVTYDFYIIAICGADTTSVPIGPFTFTTESDLSGGGAVCTYTLELFDSFGDGWNGANLTLLVGGVSSTFTVPPGGDDATFMIDLVSNQPVTVIYQPGTFENEVTYNIVDPDGNVIFSDGPFPSTGQVFTFIACPTCAGPTAFDILDLNATNASFEWNMADSAGTYTFEYGPLGFILGDGIASNPTGTNITINNLTENTYYDAYLMYDCDNGDRAKTLGPITFRTLFINDVGISGLASPNLEDCLSGDETIEVFIQNYGQAPQSLIPFFYAVNGVPANVNPPTDGLYTGIVSNDSAEVIGFDAMYDFTQPGTYFIEAWTELGTDNNTVNDTFQFELVTGYPLPLVEDFEEGVYPDLWTSSNQVVYAPGAHNNDTWVTAANVWSFNQTFITTSPRVGIVAPGDSLTFDYRYVNWSAGTTATTLNGDSLVVEISTDCGETFTPIFAITEANHVPTTEMTNVYVDLSPFAGQGITVRFRAQWALSGDYWVDLDNINITGCPVTFLSQTIVTDASTTSASDGSVIVNPTAGTAPYTFGWDDPALPATNVLDSLPVGTYSVLITDANGCQETVTVEVNVAPTSTAEVVVMHDVKLVPNPTSGILDVQIELSNTADLQMQLFDPVGRLLDSWMYQQVQRAQQRMDLSAYPSGMYFVRIATGEEVQFAKIILAK